jgi:triacylglycerol lipase
MTLSHWLWRWVVASLLSGALIIVAANLDRPWIGAVGALVLLGLHAVVLGIEFILAAVEAESGRTPRARFLQRLNAWWEEVRVDARVFGWEQAFRRSRYPAQRMGPGGERGLVFVHGFLCNRAVWNSWIDRLDSRISYVCVEAPGLLRRIDDGIDALDRAVTLLKTSTGLEPVVVAHSMGGLWVRAWLDAKVADARVHHVVTVASPHHGTRFARWGVGDNVRQMQLGSEWLRALQHREPTARAARFTCFYGHCDNVIVPAANAALEGAHNRHIAGVAHLAMLYHPAVFAEVMRRRRGCDASVVADSTRPEADHAR